ncbi:hypothetical protein MHOL44478_09975 [Mycobacterium holsaticum DSM 44478]|nr:hypothetical protein [Mycolicibacterium holsaticum DSM 44478 = JCM 12374]
MRHILEAASPPAPSLRCTDEIQATHLRNWLLGLGFDVRVAAPAVVAVAVAAPVDPVLDPPNPVAPAQDPMADALNSMLSALP